MCHVWLYLGLEYPRIGNGRRRVKVIREGWKWVTVAYQPAGPTGHTITQRIPKSLFPRLTERGKPTPRSRKR